ncbi:MAG: GNAT family N-acetyltransferase [Lachnospiraceae bacterium]|nr:GNAT family N-acetyltransferase [Lachnospiraceae bacterium]
MTNNNETPNATHNKIPTEFETERLILKVLDETYGAEVLRFYENNARVFEPVEPPRAPGFYSTGYQTRVLLFEKKEFQAERFLRLYMFQKEYPKQIIGSICFNQIRQDTFHSCILGYKQDSCFCRKGFMEEALSYCLNDLLPNNYSLHRVEATVLPSNKRSVRLLDKLGFEEIGLIPDYVYIDGGWKDHLLYSKILSSTKC